MSIKTRFLAFYSLPVLIISVALVQIYNVETSNLSRWKGGGFGMYTTINASFHIIVVNDEISSDKDNNLSKINFIYNPNEKSARKYIEYLEKTTKVKKLQIYKPILDPATNQFTHKVRYEKIIE